MGTTLFAAAVLTGAAGYFMTSDERRRLVRSAIAHARAALVAIRTPRPPADALHELLVERTGRLVVTPAILLIWTLLGIAAAVHGAPDGPIAWGANYTPRTTNGEWWRLATSALVHVGPWGLLADVAGFLPVALLLERLVGRLAVVVTYLTAGIVAAVVGMWTLSPTTAMSSAAGAVLGLYGLLAAAIVYGYARAPRLPLSRLALNRLAAGGGIFAAYVALSDQAARAGELAGLTTGVALGIVAARGVAVEKPRVRIALVAAATTAAVALAAAMPLRGTIDARPDIARIADVETRTAAQYAAAVDDFQRGRTSTRALALVIQRTILPALQADRRRIDGLHGVPAEQAPLVAAAHRYFDLREDAWRRRAGALLASNMKLLREAEQAERGALEAFERLQREASAARRPPSR